MKHARILIAHTLIALILAGCATLKQRSTPEGVPPSVGGAHGAPGDIRREVPNVTLVLGPGGAKALAHAGVIKALQENRVPIGRVVGVEWGALVGAAFAAHGQYHEVEWKLYKLDQVDLSGKGGFFGMSRDHTIKILSGFLKENFDGLDMGNLKVPFSCPSRAYWTGVQVVQRKGPLIDGLRKCLPFPGLFLTHGTWVADSTHIREIVESLKTEGPEVIVFVDVLGTASPFSKEKLQEDPSTMVLWQDVQRSIAEAQGAATEVIHVTTDGIFADRFDQRKELIQIGEAEGVRAAQRLSAKYGF